MMWCGSEQHLRATNVPRCERATAVLTRINSAGAKDGKEETAGCRGKEGRWESSDREISRERNGKWGRDPLFTRLSSQNRAPLAKAAAMDSSLLYR